MKSIMTFAPLVLLVVIMYFLLIRPQKKKEKEVNTMRSNLRVGDEIITIGGICGKIVKTKDESIVIQVGADKLKFEMMKWSVSRVVTPSNRPEPKAEEPEAEEPAKKALPKRIKKASAATEEATEAPAEAEQAVETPAETEEKKED
ncbi:MAG: preprotein translocase subunit YajC [Anaerovoracaceae bacterium]